MRAKASPDSLELPVLAALAGAASAERVGGESGFREAYESAFAFLEIRIAVCAGPGAIENQRLPTDHVRELLAVAVATCLRCALTGFVPPQLILDLVFADPPAAAMAAPLPSPSAASPIVALVDAIANPLPRVPRLFEHVVYQVADVVRDGLDDAEDLLENIPDQIRGGDPEIIGEAPNVLGELLGDPRVEDALLAAISLLAASGPSGVARFAPALALGL